MTGPERVLLGMAVEVCRKDGLILEIAPPQRDGLHWGITLINYTAEKEPKPRTFSAPTLRDALLSLLADLGRPVEWPSEEAVREAYKQMPGNFPGCLVYLRSIDPLLAALVVEGGDG